MTTVEPSVRILLCADRAVSVEIAEHIRANGGEIVAVGVNSPPRPHWRQIVSAAGVPREMVFHGHSLFGDVARRRLIDADLDLALSCGFGPVVRKDLLDLPRWGWVNIHRSFLPYNRGLDPLQWALIDKTPAGVSIHVMTEELDAGPVLAQAEMPVLPTDNADALEARADKLAVELFRSAWPALRAGEVTGVPQDDELATVHTWADCEAIRRLDRNATMPVGRVLDILRAYSRADGSEAFFTVPLMRARFAARLHIAMVEQFAAAENGQAGKSRSGSTPTFITHPTKT